ncbi:putative F-box/FBD/LRR-repeat protein at3g59240 [Phtheirospermum japonicum]|uniref:Putative F-box/FBD/LRR-repeat protein at3g59240 n=1 Tax=Phtheirospermum japonicum TaxID=374723 RepID=A0A830C588_9LAMI|nr:putative F-box/FBD/LRR-repeat protein at3g59240 [Phtheirospermum japonicum]
MQSPSLCKKSRTPRPKKCFADRLSSLPDDILHRVFFFLDFLDVVRTSVLSKRWTYVWKSVPYLNFNLDWYLKHNYNNNTFQHSGPHHKFWDFINSSLHLRDGSQIIKICLYCDNTMTDQLNGLIRVVGWRKVQEFSLLGGDYASDELEFHRGACETLTALTLNFYDTIALRVAAVFSNLRTLSLRGVCITNDAAKKLFSDGCGKLEDVNLEDCQIRDIEQIDISARNLKILTIVNVCTCEKFWVVGSFDCMLRISAPNLVSFSFVGPMLLGFVLVDTVSLKNVTIRLMRVPKGYNTKYKNHVLCPARFVGLNTAKTLTLSSLFVNYFCPTFSDSWAAFILDNVSHLELEVRYRASFWEGMINLLRCSPNIEALVIRLKEGRRPHRRSKKEIENRCSWESRVEDIACLTYNVKFIQVSNLDGSEMALELVKFLLQNGKALQKMEIMHKSVVKKRMNLSKLMALPKASSEVIISFPEHDQRIIPWFDKGDSDPELCG